MADGDDVIATAELTCRSAALHGSAERARAIARFVSAAAGVGLAALLAGFLRDGLPRPLASGAGFATLVGFIAGLHLLATLVALLAAGASRDEGACVLALGRDGSVALAGGKRPARSLARWTGGWFDGTRLGLSLADGEHLVVAPDDTAAARRAFWNLQVPRKALSRKVRKATPGTRFVLAAVLPYAVVLVAGVGVWVALVGLFYAFWSLFAGPMGWIAALSILGALIAGWWGLAKVAGAVASELADGEVTFGRDGVQVTRPDGGGWFVHHQDVFAYRPTPNAVVVELTTGERASIAAASADEATSLAGALEVLRARVWSTPTPTVPRTSESLAWGDGWLQRVTGLLRPEGGPAYRAAPTDSDELAELLESSSEVEHKLGAAAAFGASGRPELVERVRIAALATADPDVRSALEAAAEGELREETVQDLVTRPRRRARLPGPAAEE